MDKHSSKVKSRRKIVNPLFHLQTKDENDRHITPDVVKRVRSTGQLNLSSKHLSTGKQFAKTLLLNFVTFSFLHLPFDELQTFYLNIL